MAKVTKNNLEYPYNALAIVLGLDGDVTKDSIRATLFSSDDELNNTICDDDIKVIVQNILDNETYTIFESRFKDELSYSQLSEKFGKSREVYRKKILKAIEHLKENIIPAINKVCGEMKHMKANESEHKDELEKVTYAESVDIPDTPINDTNKEPEVTYVKEVDFSTDKNETQDFGGDDCDHIEPPVSAYKKKGLFGLLRKIFER